MSRPPSRFLAPWLLPLVLVLAGAVLAAWWWPNRPQAGESAMPAGKLNSVSFAPFRDGASPLTGTFSSAAEVEQDLTLLAPHVRAIRSYAALGGDYDLAAMAARHGLKLWLGVWLGGDRAQNMREMDAAIAIAADHPDTVERVVVGNEVLLRRDLPVGELIADIDRVKAAVRQPVTYADVWEFWRKFPEVAAHVDIVTIHLLPYWEDDPTGIDRAVAHVAATYRRMAALFPGKPIAIGETGWPSRGRWRHDAAPGRVNQAVFLRRFVDLAAREGLDYNLIEAFDQDWKYRNEGIVGANWGIWTADRAQKFPLAGPVREDPGWALHGAASVVLGLLLLGGALAVRRGEPARIQAWLAVLAMALGAALVFAWAGTVPDVHDPFLTLCAVVNLAAQAALAWLLLDRVGRLPAPPRTGADATRMLRALLLVRFRALAGWRGVAFPDLCFVFVWAAAVLQLLLLIDPRYRDFPLPVFAVPLLATAARVLTGDLPRGGGREELLAGGVLALGAIAGAVIEGAANLQSLAWTAAALLLAAPYLLSLRRA
jgi:exo-beta-1,3-glucanase (GH17 family)/uncharacterized membrane protein